MVVTSWTEVHRAGSGCNSGDVKQQEQHNSTLEPELFGQIYKVILEYEIFGTQWERCRWKKKILGWKELKWKEGERNWNQKKDLGEKKKKGTI